MSTCSPTTALHRVGEPALRRDFIDEIPRDGALPLHPFAAAWLRDLERQQTTVGPHRAELVIRLDGSLARARVSRGQQKLLAATLLLAQLQCDTDRGSKLAVLLVDDPAAELDARHLEALGLEFPNVLAPATHPPHNAGIGERV
jgi:hypothetical protein